MRVAIEAVRAAGCERLLVAVPTAPLRTARRIAEEVDQLYCANIRTGYSFAVADAYQAWRDVPEAEVKRLLEESPAWRDG
jgi:predicted phosphoribosyltransferase